MPRRDGTLVLCSLNSREPTEMEVVKHIVAALRSTAKLRCAPQGNPPGSTGIAWQLTDNCNVFIKLQILEARIGEEYVLIQSMHASNPQ